MDKEDGGILLKIGDGKTNVNELPDILKNDSNPPLNKKVSEDGILIL